MDENGLYGHTTQATARKTASRHTQSIVKGEHSQHCL